MTFSSVQHGIPSTCTSVETLVDSILPYMIEKEKNILVYIVDCQFCFDVNIFAWFSVDP